MPWQSPLVAWSHRTVFILFLLKYRNSTNSLWPATRTYTPRLGRDCLADQATPGLILETIVNVRWRPDRLRGRTNADIIQPLCSAQPLPHSSRGGCLNIGLSLCAWPLYSTPAWCSAAATCIHDFNQDQYGQDKHQQAHNATQIVCYRFHT